MPALPLDGSGLQQPGTTRTPSSEGKPATQAAASRDASTGTNVVPAPGGEASGTSCDPPPTTKVGRNLSRRNESAGRHLSTDGVPRAGRCPMLSDYLLRVH